MMYGVQPKKLLILNILDILRRESDKDHRLSQRDIADRIAAQYGMEPDRKAVKRNLMDLIDFGYDIEYTETVRRTPNPKTGELEENRILSDFYLTSTTASCGCSSTACCSPGTSRRASGRP